jgi:hypothetical protein
LDHHLLRDASAVTFRLPHEGTAKHQVGVLMQFRIPARVSAACEFVLLLFQLAYKPSSAQVLVRLQAPIKPKAFYLTILGVQSVIYLVAFGGDPLAKIFIPERIKLAYEIGTKIIPIGIPLLAAGPQHHPAAVDRLTGSPKPAYRISVKHYGVKALLANQQLRRRSPLAAGLVSWPWMLSALARFHQTAAGLSKAN